MEQLENYKHIQGWGADLDHKNRPAYPMEKTPPNGTGAHWDRPEQQMARMKIFKSNERPDMTRVFGTSVPPTGLSGLMRGLAFKFSENDIRHWLILLSADRVNVVEGILSDLSKGHIPNIFAEMGWRAEWKHNRQRAIGKIAIGAGLLGVASFWLMNRRAKSLNYNYHDYALDDF